MAKILIVDDEKINRAGMKKILNATFPESLISEAKNGKAALEIIEIDKPDIVITDIRMPVMDGIELMHTIAKMKIPPQIIVLSGYDDFAYAREALQAKAVSYLLKPVDKYELIASIQKVLANMKIQQKLVKEQSIEKIYTEGRVIKSLVDDNCVIEKNFCCVLMAGRNRKVVMDSLEDASSFYIVEQKNDYTILVFPPHLFQNLEERATGLGCMLCVSEEGSSIINIKTLARHAIMASFSRFGVCNENQKKTFYFTDIPHDIDYALMDKKIGKLSSVLETAEITTLTNAVEDLFFFQKEEQPQIAGLLNYLFDKFSVEFIRRFWELTDSDVYLHVKSLMLENFVLFQSISEWKQNTLDYILYLNTILRKDSGEYPFITKALAYINANYMKNINMTTVANYVSINYTYFSEKFKEHNGINFNEYLKKMRIEKACQLLEKGCFKIFEVSERCGFSDTKYFMKIFKEEKGLSPSEYKKNKEVG
jgi:two-component system response regulator YesN